MYYQRPHAGRRRHSVLRSCTASKRRCAVLRTVVSRGLGQEVYYDPDKKKVNKHLIESRAFENVTDRRNVFTESGLDARTKYLGSVPRSEGKWRVRIACKQEKVQ